MFFFGSAGCNLGCRFCQNWDIGKAREWDRLADACRELGIKSVAATAGYITDDARPEFYRHMDVANVDPKAFTEECCHRQCFGQLAAEWFA